MATSKSLPSVFLKAAKEFDSAEPASIPNRQWVEDAFAEHGKGATQYPPGVVAEPAPFDVQRLTMLLYMTHVDVRYRLYELFKHPDFHPRPGETMAQERARVMRMWSHVCALGLIENSLSQGTPEGRARYDAVIESCGMVSHALDIKMSVHYGLFGATLGMLGDDRQRSEWMPKVERCEMLGCFALTELGHGSNARGVQTTATYDVSSSEFVVNTPSDFAQKYWIGGAAISARWSAVFAQLYVNGTCYGIHAFLVRIRHDNGTLVRGVTLADCGHKLGMNGVDNGRMWFDNVRIPHEHMLRRLSQVNKNGVFTSKIRSGDERFGAFMALLSGGRISVASAALNQAKIGLSIAVRYALSRKAFGETGKEEVRLLDYHLHQYRLLPALAGTISLQLIHNKLKARWHGRELGKDMHVWSSGFKAAITWFSIKTLQEAREACGGQGYKTENKIGELKNSHDVALTYEGDNHILMQAVTKLMIGEFMRGVRNGKKFEGHFKYLTDGGSLTATDLSKLDVQSMEFVQTVMRRREAAVFSKLGAMMEQFRGKGASTFEALNLCGVSVEEAGWAHTELLMANVMHDIVEELKKSGDKKIAEVVETCWILFALWRIDAQNVFLRVGALGRGEGERVHNSVQVLCTKIRPMALHLVNAFGIPPHLLAPIAFDYVKHNSASRL